MTYIYWLGFIFSVFFLLADQIKLTKAYFRYLLFVPAIIVTWSLGAAGAEHAFDVDTYRAIYSRLVNPPGGFDFNMFPEYGYQLINYLSNRFLNLSFEQFRFIYCISILLILFLFIRRYTSHFGLFSLLYYPKYFLIGVISHSRSGFVAPFILLIIDWVIKRRYWSIITLVLALSFIHRSVLIALLLIPLARIKLKTWMVIVIIPFSIVFSMYLSPLVSGILGSFDIRGTHYFDAFQYSQDDGFGIEMLRRALIVCFCLYMMIQNKVNDERLELIIKTFLISVFFYIGFFDAKFISDRVGGMFGFIEPLMLVLFFQAHLKSSNRIIFLIVISAYGILDFILRALVIKSIPSHYSLSIILDRLI